MISPNRSHSSRTDRVSSTAAPRQSQTQTPPLYSTTPPNPTLYHSTIVHNQIQIHIMHLITISRTWYTFPAPTMDEWSSSSIPTGALLVSTSPIIPWPFVGLWTMCILIPGHMDVHLMDRMDLDLDWRESIADRCIRSRSKDTIVSLSMRTVAALSSTVKPVEGIYSQCNCKGMRLVKPRF